MRGLILSSILAASTVDAFTPTRPSVWKCDKGTAIYRNIHTGGAGRRNHKKDKVGECKGYEFFIVQDFNSQGGDVTPCNEIYISQVDPDSMKVPRGFDAKHGFVHRGAMTHEWGKKKIQLQDSANWKVQKWRRSQKFRSADELVFHLEQDTVDKRPHHRDDWVREGQNDNDEPVLHRGEKLIVAELSGKEVGILEQGSQRNKVRFEVGGRFIEGWVGRNNLKGGHKDKEMGL